MESVGTVRFTVDDPGHLWREGELAADLGWESILPEDDPDFVPVRLLRLRGETLALTDPFGRGLIEHVAV
jgi:hypothetical protein